MGGAEPGPAKRERHTGAVAEQRHPYLVEIMDAFSDDTTEKIIFVKPTQVGGTSAMENALGSLIDQEPAPTMVVYPSDALAERTVEAKLEPMIRQCKVLAEKYREHESKRLELKFQGMTVYLTGANSAADLSSTNIRNLFLDEVDKFPGATKKEADPVSLAIERTKTYFNRKIFLASTPTLKTGPIWKAKEEADAEKHYFVPCPHCGEFIELKFAQIKWPSKDDVPDQAERAEGHLCVPGVWVYHHRPGQGGHAPGGPVAGRPADHDDAQKCGVLDEYPVFPIHQVFRHRQGVHAVQGRPGTAPQLRQLLAGRAVGGHETENQRRNGHGAADGGSGLVPPGVDQTADRRDRRAGKLPVLGDPGWGIL